MSGTIDAGWFCAARRQDWQGRDDLGRPGLPLVHPTPRQWYHEADGVKIHMPTASNLRLLEAEHVGKPWGSKHGPRATAFRASVVSWAAELVEEFRGDGSRVTGALGESIVGGTPGLPTCQRRSAETTDTCSRTGWIGRGSTGYHL